MAGIVLLATVDTKASEAEYLAAALARHGLSVEVVDLSLGAEGMIWPGDRKIARMREIAAKAADRLSRAVAEGANAAIGIGGGSGGEMILRIMESQPIDFPQLLVTTLPFDPRPALARTGIILVPTLVDFSGLNAPMRLVLERSAAMVAGLVATPQSQRSIPSVAISVLGATQSGADALVAHVREAGTESTLFHANGYGGAALIRFARSGSFRALVDLTPHELTRMHLAGAHVAMPDRFSVAGELGLPHVVLPGGLNFIGLGPLETLPEAYRQRPHYAHSGFFTHVKVTKAEMASVARLLAENLNAARASVTVIVPMGGFSHQDCRGGAIEDQGLRDVFLETMQAHAGSKSRIQPIDTHINHPHTAARVFEAVKPFLI